MNIKKYSKYSDRQLEVMGRIFKKFVFKNDLPDEIKSVSYRLDTNRNFDVLFGNDNHEKSIKEYITRIFDINKLKTRDILEIEEEYDEELKNSNNKPKFTFKLNLGTDSSL